MGETIDLGNLFHTVTRDLVKNQGSSDSAQQQSSASQGGDLLGSLSGGLSASGGLQDGQFQQSTQLPTHFLACHCEASVFCWLKQTPSQPRDCFVGQRPPSSQRHRLG